MEKDRFEYVRTQAEQGRDVFVFSPGDGMEGRVMTCSGNEISFQDPQGERRTYDYRALEEITRSNQEWPRSS